MICNRREFGRLARSGLPAAAMFTTLRSAVASPNSRIRGVQIGTITYSFKNDVKKPEEIIPDLVQIGLSSVELMWNDAEVLAGAPQVSNFGRGPQLNPAQQAAIEGSQRDRRAWREKANPETFARVRDAFESRGIHLDILCYNMPGNIADEEIDYAFRMAQAMKVKAISSTSTVAVARRVAPVADKYRIVWAGHGHTAVDDPNEFATEQSFELIMSLSKHIGVNLDIGHYTAAGFDAVAFIKKHHARITNLHLKDRKKNGGPNMPWGEGETPIREVLQLMRAERYEFPANIELEYPIPAGSNSVAEISKCFEYARKCLEA
jgi:sugar phosphate isomerase/epimerase